MAYLVTITLRKVVFKVLLFGYHEFIAPIPNFFAKIEVIFIILQFDSAGIEFALPGLYLLIKTSALASALFPDIFKQTEEC